MEVKKANGQDSRQISGLDKTPIAIVVSQFNSYVTDQLYKGALSVLLSQGIPESSIITLRVPGAFEIPIACQRVIKKYRCSGVIALGAVIRGDTPHFDIVAGQCASGVMRVSLDSSVPIAFGVLTTDTVEQALNRAGLKSGNKGEEAARTLLEMISVLGDES